MRRNGMGIGGIIITIVISASLIFTGGFFVGKNNAPKEIINHNYQEIKQESQQTQLQHTEQKAIQAQVTIIMDAESTNRIINVRFLDMTNVIISNFNSSKTNWKTNYIDKK